MAWAAIDWDALDVRVAADGAVLDPVGHPKLAIGAAKAEHHLCQQIPGCTYTKVDQIWRAPLNWATYVCFRTIWALQPVDETPQLATWAEYAWKEIQARYDDRRRIEAPAQALEILNTITSGPPLTAAQLGGAAWLARWGRCGLEDPGGSGKSPQLIRAIQLRQETEGDALPVLLICPGAAVYPWRDKLAQWAPELTVSVASGTATKRRDALEIPADVYVLAWPNVRLHTRLAAYPGQRFIRCPQHGGIDDRVTAGRCHVHEKELNNQKFGTVIADEAHRLKDARSLQTRAVWWLAHNANCFWPATGTLAENVADVWPVMHAMLPDAFPVRSRYIDLFAEKRMEWHGGTEVLGVRPDNAAAFHSIVQPYWRRIPKEIARPHDGVRLPPEFRYVELPPSIAKVYRQLKKDALADLPAGGTVVSANSLVTFGRLCQLASSAIEVQDSEDKDGFTRQEIELVLPSPKADDLLEFLEDNPGQLVVAANSPRLVTPMRGKLDAAKITSCQITGGMSDAAKYQANTWFQNGDCRVCFITAGAGGEAIDLMAADTVYFAQPNPSWRSREQVIWRVDRFGQRFAVRTVYAITRGSVEERLYRLGCEKEERAGQVSQDAALLRWIIQGDDDDHGA